MSPRLAALAIILANVALSGCVNQPQPPRQLPLFLQQGEGQASEETVYTSQPNPTDPPAQELAPTETNDSDWRPILPAGPDPLAEQARQNLALAMNSTDRIARFEYLETAASYGSGQAHYELAKVFTEGVDRPRNLQLAQEHLLAAVSLDDPEASRVVGWQMIKGQGGYEQNLMGGVAVMEMFAEQSIRTQRELGSLYANLYSDYKLNDPAKGEQYLEQAFKSGDTPAALALGKLYIQQGRTAEAVTPLEFASGNNNVAAQKLLKSLGPNFGVPEPKNSESYYQQASALMLVRHGTNDEAKAYALFSLAGDMGHNLAKVELAALSGVAILMEKQRGSGWLEIEKEAILRQQN